MRCRAKQRSLPQVPDVHAVLLGGELGRTQVDMGLGLRKAGFAGETAMPFMTSLHVPSVRRNAFKRLLQDLPSVAPFCVK